MRANLLASRLDTMQESTTLALNARAKKLASEGRPMLNLTAGELSSDTPDYIQQSVKKTLHQNKYTAAAGLPELRKLLAKESRDFYNLDWIEDKNVVVTAGAKPALYATFLALINPGDEVIVPTPAWVSYMHLIELVGGKVVHVPLHESFDLDVNVVAKNITKKTKLILLNSPHNPTGSIYSKESLLQLHGLVEKTDITILADDIYSKLVFSPTFTIVPSLKFKNIVIINGFSKSQALTGWRIGYLIAEELVANAIIKLLSHITGNASVLSQHAALAALKKHDKPPLSTINLLKEHRELVRTALSHAHGIHFTIPEGAFYFFLDLRDITTDSANWCEDLLQETGVVLVPGEAFLAPGFARLTFSVDKDTLQSALEKIVAFSRTRK